MKKFFLLVLILGSIFRFTAKADEGMWIPMLVEKLNYAEMQKLGLKLTPEQIYSVNNSSLKDAIVIFGRGCTGEIISDQGLVLTNHHCGYG
ncbi:MAG: S46 family peptidase, partial [Ignavibacteria bacterium]|nr:S46 family peptidase [Ignavibacteria bacterium]